MGPNDPVFVLREDDRQYDAAKLFRAHLRAAGIDRAELFARTAQRQPIRAHDLRATFVTLNLAAGRTETWIADRTGHKTSAMINRYRRSARTAAELGLGELLPLADAVPELAAWGGDSESGPPGESAQGPSEAAPPLAMAPNGETSTERSTAISPNSGASGEPSSTLNPLIVVRIHAPELGRAQRP